MPMALGMIGISNLGCMHCTTAVSLEMSDEPIIIPLFVKDALAHISVFAIIYFHYSCSFANRLQFGFR